MRDKNKKFVHNIYCNTTHFFIVLCIFFWDTLLRIYFLFFIYFFFLMGRYFEKHGLSWDLHKLRKYFN